MGGKLDGIQKGGNMTGRPLGRKSYESIPHLPESRLGSGDHYCDLTQAKIATQQKRDRNDVVIVTEKADGSNVAISKVNGVIYPLTRSGYPADSSRFRQHHMFAAWVYAKQGLWMDSLSDGEWVSGEWLAQAHGTRYDLKKAICRSPFVAFDLWREQKRVAWDIFEEWMQRRLLLEGIGQVRVLSRGDSFSVASALTLLEDRSYHGALDPIEGAVWRVERNDKVVFLCKYVRHEKVDGCYLPKLTGESEIWNWKKE